MSHLFQRLADKQSADQQNDTERYYGLLATIDIQSPTAADLKSLTSLLRSLGKSVTDAEADHQQLVLIRQTMDAALSTMDAPGKVGIANAVRDKALAHRQTEWRRINDETVAAINAANEADARADEHHQNV